MTDAMRIDSEDLQFVMKDTGGPIVHINARGWMELHDLENLYLFVGEAIQRRRPTPETSEYLQVEKDCRGCHGPCGACRACNCDDSSAGPCPVHG